MDYFELNKEFKKDLFYPNLKKKRKVLIEFLRIFVIGFFACLGLFLSLSWVEKGKVLENKAELLQNIEKPVEINSATSNSFISDPWQLSSFERDQKQRINFLFLGIPGEPWPGAYLCDSILLVSLNPQKKMITFISIPRDLLVKIPGQSWEIKINSLLALDSGKDLIRKAVSEVTGIYPPYFLILELSSFEKIIDLLGGIDIEVKEDIFDPYFPTPDRGYETFALKKGLWHLDGKTASKYVRTRHEALGDLARIARQQQVLKAIFEKSKTIDAFKDFKKILEFFELLHGHEKTNLKISQIKELWELSKVLKDENFQFFTLTFQGENPLLVPKKVFLGKNLSDVLIPKEGMFNYSAIQREVEKLTI
jgi:LCP family protein required for cell wall assembly